MEEGGILFRIVATSINADEYGARISNHGLTSDL
jgi:hypothetical protein